MSGTSYLRVLYRVVTPEGFEWHSLPGLHTDKEAEAQCKLLVERFKLEPLVVSNYLFSTIGIPQTYGAEEYQRKVKVLPIIIPEIANSYSLTSGVAYTGD